MTREISLKEVELMAFELARQLMNYDEPIPDYSTRFANILESCIAMPFMRIGGKYLHKSLIEQASYLLYLMIKNHPFQNGNKRIAITTLLCFLFLNKKWLQTDAVNLYNFTIWVAQSLPEIKDEVVAGIKKYLGNHLVDL